MIPNALDIIAIFLGAILVLLFAIFLVGVAILGKLNNK